MLGRVSLCCALLVGVIATKEIYFSETAVAAVNGVTYGGDLGQPWKDDTVTSFEDCKNKIKNLGDGSYSLQPNSCELLDPPRDWTKAEIDAWGPEYACTYEKTSSTLIYGCNSALQKLNKEVYTRSYSCREFTDKSGQHRAILIKTDDSKAIRATATTKYMTPSGSACASLPWEESRESFHFGLCTDKQQANLGAVLTVARFYLGGGKVSYDVTTGKVYTSTPPLKVVNHTSQDTQYCSGPGGVENCKFASPYSTSTNSTPGVAPVQLNWPPVQ